MPLQRLVPIAFCTVIDMYNYDYDYDYDLIQGKGDACKPAQYIVTLLLYS